MTVRDFPGLFEAANEPFEAVGLDMPWYTAFGNHDALVQGNSPEAFFGPMGPGPLPGEAFEEYDEAFHRIATGCVKVMQPAAGVRSGIEELVAQIQALRDGDVTPEDQETIDELTGAGSRDRLRRAPAPCDPDADDGCVVEIVPPDPRRCFLPKDEPNTTAPGSPCQTGSWIKQHFRTTGTPVGHGFAPSPALPLEKQGPFCADHPADEDCVRASYGRPPEAARNNDGYYSFSPRSGLRFVVLDTITDECGSEFCSEGSVDDTQFQWMRGQIISAEALDAVRDLLRAPHASNDALPQHRPHRAAAPLRPARRPPQPRQPAEPGRRRDTRGALLRVARGARVRGRPRARELRRAPRLLRRRPAAAEVHRSPAPRSSAGTRTSGRSRAPPTSTGRSRPG